MQAKTAQVRHNPASGRGRPKPAPLLLSCVLIHAQWGGLMVAGWTGDASVCAAGRAVGGSVMHSVVVAI